MISHINSKNRENFNNTTSSSFEIVLNKPNNANRVCLTQISIPKSFYLINTNKNILYLDSNPVSIDIGNYSVNDMVASLSSHMTCSINYKTGKLSFASSSHTTLELKQDGTDLSQALGLDMGTHTFPFSSQRVVNFQPISIIYLNSNLVNSQTTTFTNQILSKLFVGSNSTFSNFSYVNPIPLQTAVRIEQEPNPNKNIGVVKASFSIYDQDLELINLNNQDFEFDLYFFEEQNLYSILNDIKGRFFMFTERMFDFLRVITDFFINLS